MDSSGGLQLGELRLSDLRRLIERDFPVEPVSRAGLREKSVRQGHLSTLQMWWARRPQSVCRAVLFATLAPASSTIAGNPAIAAELLRHSAQGSLDDALLKLTADLAELRMESPEGQAALELAASLLALGRDAPAVVVDSFAGGGSVPVEALRLGLETHASDLSPVATAALRVAIEEAPNSVALVADYLSLMVEVEQRVAETMAGLYCPADSDAPLAFFWCRTYTCAGCGIAVPLIKDVNLEKGRNRASVSFEPDDTANLFRFTVRSGANAAGASTPTVAKSGATCPRCSLQTSFDSLRSMAKRGGIGEQLYAVAFQTSEGRRYRSPDAEDLSRVATARQVAAEIRESGVLSAMPLDRNGIRHLWSMQYGIADVVDLFSDRQLVALRSVQSAMADIIGRLEREGVVSSRALSILLALTLNRLVMYGSRHTWWQSNGAFPANMFGRQAIPMIWNFVEIPVLSRRASGMASATSWIERAVAQLTLLPRSGEVRCADAATLKLEDGTVDLVMIDPPYFDSITYAYLADVFYAWMQPLLRSQLPEFDPLVPSRSEEAIVDRPHREASASKDDVHFFEKMREAFEEAGRVLRDDGRLVVMFGHKSAHAWAVFLRALTTAGFRPLSSWPIESERKSKFGSYRLDSLSTACVITCVHDASNAVESVSWQAFELSLAAELRRTIRGLREADRYGTELTTALLAPAVGHFCACRVTDESGTDLAMEAFLDRMPEVVERVIQLEALESLASAGLSDIGASLRGLHLGDFGESSNWMSHNWDHEVPRRAIELLASSQGDPGEPELPLALLDAVCQFLHAAAAFSSPGSSEHQAALAGVSGLSSALRRRDG